MKRETACHLRNCIEFYKTFIKGKDLIPDHIKIELGYLAHAVSLYIDDKSADLPLDLIYGHNFPNRFAHDIVILDAYINPKRSRNLQPDVAKIAIEDIETVLPIIEIIVNSVLGPND